ncbi:MULTISPECIES: Spy/CpxP family protein refolding chaperone [unclassified Thioalkalivibrio]|uniref:Spy/CpxP family protein refolding chaperone n=1 Tax=unclassified Thioalkalivibrio TaxID=2621013 RepID=UPI0018CA010D|nr:MULTISPECIES: Spy/CpxP family protein refolding chaperone [unclassified Thioalkalivibrio]
MHRVLRFSGWLVVGLALVVAAPAAANPYSELQAREIKALSAQETEDLLEGRGMGMALPAELHGYPGPMHVLEVADSLELTPEQQRETERLFAVMREQARDLGRRIVERERELDARFAEGGISSATIESLTVEIGELRGRLRHLHLSYHLEMDALLDAEQKARYRQARGYQGESESESDGSPGAHSGGGHHGHHPGHEGHHH